jgi:hypothetical protein
MNDKPDWRLTNQEKWLKDVTLVHRKYRLYHKNPTWDHGHCTFCRVTFALFDDPSVLKEAYATEDDHHWICPQCFNDFKDRFQWKVIEATEDKRV